MTVIQPFDPAERVREMIMIKLREKNTPKNLLFTNADLKKLIVPLIIEQFLSVMVGMADIMMVSAAGETAVSGVALVDLINVLIINIFAALGTGGAVVVAQLLGARQKERARQAACQLVYITAAIGIVMMAAVCLWRSPLLHLLFGSTEKAVMDSALIYFLISAFSYPFIAVYNAGAALFRAQGNSRISMYISALMNVVNIIGNAVFVYVFHRGADGVAASSTISRAMAAVIVIALLHKKTLEVYVEKLLHFKLDRRLILRILSIGIPNSLENSFFQLGRVLLVSMISGFGTVQITANAVGNNLAAFCIMPGQAMGLALVTVIGQCVGSGDFVQVRYYLKKLMKYTYIMMWALNLVLFLILPVILSAYNMSEETYTLALILICIHNISAIFLWPLSFTMPNALRAANDVRFPMAISIFSMCVFRLGFSYVIGVIFGYGAIGVWIAMVIDWVFRVICFLLRVRRVLWKMHPLPRV